VDSLKALDPERPIREADCCSQIPVRGDDGARAIGANEMMMMRPLRRRRLTAISYGVDGADTPDRKPR
jgi:hypothetical protein